jgi:hypothetical protein
MRFAQESTALPLDVRKAVGLPGKMYFVLRLRVTPDFVGAQPLIMYDNSDGSAQRFPTSGGIAESGQRKAIED